MSDPYQHSAYERWASNRSVCVHGSQTRKCPHCEIEAMHTMIMDYHEALEFIADYPDPDFPAGDMEGEWKRAESIYTTMRQLAQVVLGRPLFRGPML